MFAVGVGVSEAAGDALGRPIATFGGAVTTGSR
jgi:hypothetical protein